MRRLVVTAMLVIGLVAAAPAAPAGADFDGGACTLVPDQIPGLLDFTAACVRHDACYAAGVDRLACDRTFRLDMIGLCQAQHPEALDPARLICITFAELYFLGVRLFGGPAFS